MACGYDSFSESAAIRKVPLRATSEALIADGVGRADRPRGTPATHSPFQGTVTRHYRAFIAANWQLPQLSAQWQSRLSRSLIHAPVHAHGGPIADLLLNRATQGLDRRA